MISVIGAVSLHHCHTAHRRRVLAINIVRRFVDVRAQQQRMAQASHIRD